MHNTDWCWPLLLCKYWWWTSKQVRWRLLLSTSHHKTLPMGVPQAFYIGMKLSIMLLGQQATPPHSCLKLGNSVQHQGFPRSPRQGWVPSGTLRQVSNAGGYFLIKVFWQHGDLCPTQHPAASTGELIPLSGHNWELAFSFIWGKTRSLGGQMLRSVRAMEYQEVKQKPKLHAQTTVPKGKLFWTTHHMIGILSGCMQKFSVLETSFAIFW